MTQETLARTPRGRAHNRTRRPTAPWRATSGLLGLALAAGLVGLPAADAAAAGTAPPLSGVFAGGAARGSVDAFGTWRGRTADVALAFLPGSNWAGIEVPGWFTDHWGSSAYRDRMIVTMQMLPMSDPSTTLEQGASGAYDEHFITAARRLVAGGMGNAILRIGHESNGSWYRWSAQRNPAAYAAYFRRIVTAMRSVPGQHFRFDWNLASGGYDWDATKAYPGDDVVDTIGLDVYDQKWGDAAATPQERWDWLVTGKGAVPQGLAFWADFASRHGKQISYAEWGLVDRDAPMAAGGGGGDDAYFVEKMHEWISTHDVAFESYFDVDAPDGKHALDRFPAAAEAYRRLFGPTPVADATPIQLPAPSGPSPAPTPAPAPPSPAPDTASTGPAFPLLLSGSSDRTGGTALDGATLTGPVYVVATPDAARSVSFYVDDPSAVGQPLRVEVGAPYDLGGTDGDVARPFDPATLSPGAHTVTARAVLGDGSTRSVTAAVTVVRPTPIATSPRLAPTVPLLVSSKPDRSGAVALAGQTLRGDAYVFAGGDATRSVRFYLDDPRMARPARQVETAAPFDFAGTSDTQARPLRTSGLSRGRHTITVAATLADGSTVVTSGTFSVG